MSNIEEQKPFRITNEFSDCSLCLTSDIYSRCAFNCSYCFSSQFRHWNPQTRYKKIPLKTIDTNKYIKIIEGKYPNNPYYQNFLSKRFVLHFGSLSEPFDYFELKHKAGLGLYEYMADIKYPALFSTKGISLFLNIPEYQKIIEKTSKNHNFAYQFSIVTNSDKIASKIELGAPSTTERLRAMKELSDMGSTCILRLRPFIIGITDDGLEELLERSKQAGAKAVSVEFYCLDKRALDLASTKIISDTIGTDIIKFYRKLSPNHRGTYMRLNRRVKEYFMRRLWIKCKELGLNVSVSDADYKELNFSSCCCGLDENYLLNPELSNFNKGQFTTLLINGRKRWEKGEKNILFYFDDIKNNVFNNWMDEHKYWGDSIVCYQSDYERLNTGHLREFNELWNSFSTPRNPYKYFDGLLKPVGIDKKGNVIYKFNPPPYLEVWKEEGIL